MTDMRIDISQMEIAVEPGTQTNIESIVQALAELKDYFARLSALRANAAAAVSSDGQRYHELDV
jgi:hypothetical protein